MTLQRSICSVAAMLATAFTLLVPQAHAEPSPALDRFSFSAGAFNADPTLNARVDTNFGRLDTGDVQRNKVTLGRVKADLLIFDSQGLSFDYYQFRRGYGGSFASNVSTGSGNVLTTGAANLDVKVDFAKLAYKWWLGSGSTVFGIGAGAAYYKASFNLGATAAVGGANGAINSSYSDDAYAPLLEVGIRHALSDNIRLFADASGISKGGGAVSGNIYNAALGVEWFPLKNVGVVVDYSSSQVKLHRNNASGAEFNMKLTGPSAYVKVRF